MNNITNIFLNGKFFFSRACSPSIKHHGVPGELPLVVLEPRGEYLAGAEPAHEDCVSFPEMEVIELIIGDPVELTFVGFDQIACEFSGSENKNVPVFDVVESRECNKTLKPGVGDVQT